MTIKEFHKKRISKIQYTNSLEENGGSICSVEDFYNSFLINRAPKKEFVEKWHDLLVWYLNEPDAILLVRKYESTKKRGIWDNRRGAVVNYDDGFEFAYASNFLAHEIYLMAFNGFVPDKADFKQAIKNRELPITSGTNVEKQIRLYSVPNKQPGDCYLAHIMDVNGQYLRDNGQYQVLSKTESDKMYPHGEAINWTSSPDKIWHQPGNLSQEEKDLIRAHFLRFLDPMNYYLTPKTEHCDHSITTLKKNIGEYPCLTFYVQERYRKEFGYRFEELIRIGRYVEKMPLGYTGHNTINLTYSNSKVAKKGSKKTSTKTTPTTRDESKGTLANTVLRKILSEEKITPATLQALLSKEESKKLFGLNYPLLTENRETAKGRYYKKPVRIFKKDYYICNDWYEPSREKLSQWILSLSSN